MVVASRELGGNPPSFGRPPVVEVAAGVQFRSLFGLRGITLGPLREQWRSRYPQVQEVPPLPPQIEAAPSGAGGVQLSFGPVPSNRWWFLNADDGELVQVQNDRLIVNWGRTPVGSAYPRYGAIRELFSTRFEDLRAFVADEGLGGLEVTQAELTYINSIPEIVRAPSGDVLAGLAWPRPESLGAPEQMRVAASFTLPGVGTPPVRLHMSVEPGADPDGAPTAFLTLTVRGAPADSSEDATLALLDAAHVAIVGSFTEVTTEPMHRRWERIR